MVIMKTKKRTQAFRDDLCDLCGLCLHLCPVLQLPIQEAKEEIKKLIDGKESETVLYKCNTCLSCNLYCPHNANPYRFVCPTMEPNIW